MGQGASCENEETRGQQPQQQQRDEQIQAVLLQQQLQMLQNQQQYEGGQLKQVAINGNRSNATSQQLQQAMIQFQEQQQHTQNMLPQTSNINSEFSKGISKNHQQQYSQNLIGERDISPIQQQFQQQQQQIQQQLSQNKIDTLRDGVITASHSYRTTLRPSTKYKPSSQIKEKHLDDPSDEDEHLSMNFSPKKITIQSNQTQPLIAQHKVQSIQPSPSETAAKPRFLSPHQSQTQSTAKPIISFDGNQPAAQLSKRKTSKSPIKKQIQETKHQQLSQQQFVQQNNIKIHKQHSLQPQHPTSAALVPDYKIQKSHGLQSFENQESSSFLNLHQKNSLKNEDQSYKLIQQSQQFQQPHSAIEEKSHDQAIHNRIQPQQHDGFLSSSSLGLETNERQMRTPNLQQSYSVIPSTQSASSQQAIQIQQQQMQFKQQEEQLKQFKYQQDIENTLKSQQLLEQQQFKQQQQENMQYQQQMLMEQQKYEQQQFNFNNGFEDKISQKVLLEKNNSINTRKEISYRSSSPVSSPFGVVVANARGRENINQLKNTTSQQPEKLQIHEYQQQKYPKPQENNHKDYQLQQCQQDHQFILKNKQLNTRSKSKKRFIDSSCSSESPPSCNKYQDSDEELNHNYLTNTNNRNDFNNHHLKHTKSQRDISSKHSKRNNKPVGTNSNTHQIIEQHTRISHRHSHKNKSNTINAGISNHTQYSHQASATQLYNEEYSAFHSQAKLNPATFYSSPSIYHQSQQQQYPQMHTQHQAAGLVQNRLSVGNNGYSYPLVNQPQQAQLVSPFQMMMSAQNLSLQQQQQNTPVDFIQQQLVQSQIALAQAQQNHQAQIQGILLMQQQQQQQQQQQLQQQQLQNQFGGMFANVPNQLVVTQLNQMNTLNQFPLGNSQIDNYAKNQYQGNNYFNINNNSAGMLQPPSNMSGFIQPVCHTGSSESNHSLGTHYLSQQGQQSHPGSPQQFPIIINNNVVSPTKTHLGDNLIHMQAENYAKSQYEKHFHSNTSIDNNIKAKSKNHTNVRYLCDDESAARQETNPERVHNQVLVDSPLSEVDQHKQQRELNIPAKIDKPKGKAVEEEEILAQKSKESKQGQEIQLEPDNSYLENNNSNASKLKKFNSFNEYHKNEMDADPLNLEDTNIQQQNMNSKVPNGKNQQKTLAEIFQEKRGKLAVQKMEEQQQQQQQLGTASNKTQTTGGGKRTKEEIIKMRQDMMEYGTKVNPKLKAKQQQRIHHADSDITGDVVLKEQRHKSPIYSKQKEELMIRLAQGVKPKISEKEMYALTKKNYENLPEVKKKRQEQEKQMNKSEMLKVKQEKLKELDEKRRTQFQQKPLISQLSSPKATLSNYNSISQLNLADQEEVQQ